MPRISLLSVPTGASLLFVLACCTAMAQDESPPQNLLAERDRCLLSLYRPEVPTPRVVRITSDAAAKEFAMAGWGEDKSELHVDFDTQQVLAIAWGPQPFVTNREEGRGWRAGVLELEIERAIVDDGVLRVTVQTALPVGGFDEPRVGDGSRTWYPAQFLVAPRTERVEVDVVGARRRDRERDFAAQSSKGLIVRVHPDAAPARDRLLVVELDRTLPILGGQGGPDAAGYELIEAEGHLRLEIDWGRQDGYCAYDFSVVGAVLVDQKLRLTVRAEHRGPFNGSGVPTVWPAYGLQLPPVENVELHILRVGKPLHGGADRDFEPFTSEDGKLRVTVEHDLQG